MKIIYSEILPPKGFSAINLFGIMFVKRGSKPPSERIINHERIHTAQMKELLYILFYLWYFFEWLFRLIQYRNFDQAYRNISFEREAYANDRNLDYISKRRKYASFKYLINRKNENKEI